MTEGLTGMRHETGSSVFCFQWPLWPAGIASFTPAMPYMLLVPVAASCWQVLIIGRIRSADVRGFKHVQTHVRVGHALLLMPAISVEGSGNMSTA